MHPKSIELLNKAVADELSAVHQYMYLHFHCDDQGFDLLANLFKRTAIEEMLHIEKLADRILFLKGEVEMVASSSVKKIHDVAEMLKLGTAMEESSAKDYNKFAMECPPMQIPLQNICSKAWLLTKKDITISLITNLTT
jgi:bacterioferritin